jgi:galactokinase
MNTGYEPVVSLADVTELFQRTYDAWPSLVVRAPGRINLIGEHTDYNNGLVFPVAIDREVWLAVRESNHRTNLYSSALGPGESFDAKQVVHLHSNSWSRYPAGAAWILSKRFKIELPNLEIAVWSDLPLASGISSSAALLVAAVLTYSQLVALDLSALEIAKLAQAAEREYVGVQCGLMDQTASACGVAGHALFFDTSTEEIRPVPLPKDLAIVLCDTGRKRELTDSAYNQRRSECEEACELLGVESLRDATLEDVEKLPNSVPKRRARHVVTENERVIRFAEALCRGDKVGFGMLMAGSHASLRDDYEVSCEELDSMFDAALSSPGCLGCRMTGAGFGGACVALVQQNRVGEFLMKVDRTYARSSDCQPSFAICSATDGASAVRIS